MVSHEVREWAIENGNDPRMRIALCGYEGEHAMPGTWECVPWKARGGYGSQGEGRGRDNSARERIWFSPHCLKLPTLFDLFRAEDAVYNDPEATELSRQQGSEETIGHMA
jgi:hypothetical protein